MKIGTYGCIPSFYARSLDIISFQKWCHNGYQRCQRNSQIHSFNTSISEWKNHKRLESGRRDTTARVNHLTFSEFSQLSSGPPTPIQKLITCHQSLLHTSIWRGVSPGPSLYGLVRQETNHTQASELRRTRAQSSGSRLPTGEGLEQSKRSRRKSGLEPSLQEEEAMGRRGISQQPWREGKANPHCAHTAWQSRLRWERSRPC